MCQLFTILKQHRSFYFHNYFFYGFNGLLKETQMDSDGISTYDPVASHSPPPKDRDNIEHIIEKFTFFGVKNFYLTVNL